MLIQIFLQPVKKQADSIEAQSFALVMEVKVCVMHIGIVELRHGALKRFLHWLFVAFLIYEIDNVDIAILFNERLNMPPQGVNLLR